MMNGVLTGSARVGTGVAEGGVVFGKTARLVVQDATSRQAVSKPMSGRIMTNVD
jgi:hypothetical protein